MLRILRKSILFLIVLLFTLSFLSTPSNAMPENFAQQDRIWVTGIYTDGQQSPSSIYYKKNNNNYIYAGYINKYSSRKLSNGYIRTFFEGWIYNTGIGTNQNIGIQ